MRCVVRIILLTVFVFALFIYFAVAHANTKIVVAYDANDEEARRILDSAIPSPTVASPFQSNGGPQSMSVSVALVLIVSLISVALLITGIIIIAVTLDPTSSNEEDEESDLEVDEPAHRLIKKSDEPVADPNGYYPRFDYDFGTSTVILSEL